MSSYSKVLLLVALMLSVHVQAQLFDQTERKYREGVEWYKMGRFEPVMETMAEITTGSSDSPFAPLAHYYYSLAAYRLKKYNEGNLMLRQLLTRYPTWSQKDEAYYLLASNYLSLNDYKTGFDYLNRISDPRLENDIRGLKQNHLSDVKDVEVLKSLYQQYPTDRVLAIALVNLIQTSSAKKADLELSDKLTNQFDIGVVTTPVRQEPKQEKRYPAYDKKWTKGYYNVAVLFPYRLPDFAPGKRLSNQYAYDYYEGLQIAKQQLKAEGILINVQAYDVGNEEDPVMDMLNNVYFRQSDLILGPLYTNTFNLVSTFANEHGIPLINPLATDGTLLESGELVYLAHPSIQQQTSEVLRLVKSREKQPKAAIYYGRTSKDSAMAVLYRDQVLKAGGKIVEMKELPGTGPEMNARISTFEGEKPNHIAFFSNESKAGQALMSVLSGRNLGSIPVVAVANSFDFYKSRPTGYGPNLYLIEPDFVNQSKENLRDFQKKYYDETNTLPSVYSYQGYDQMLFFGRMLAKHQDKFKDGVSIRKYDEDYLLSGFDFTRSQDNAIPFLLKFEGSRWQPWE